MNRRNGIDNVTLSDISDKLVDEWKKLVIHLGFKDPEAKIREFEVNNPRDVRHQKYQMLTEWRRGQPSTEGQMDVMCRALEKIDRNDIVLWLQGRTVVPGPTPLEYCQQQLTRHYKDKASTIPAHPADPSRTRPMGRFYSDLELTRGLKDNQTLREPIQLKEETLNLDRVQTVPLDAWEDMLNLNYMVGNLRIIVSGGAGFGKTILLLRVANASIIIDPKLPLSKFKLVFLVFLREMQESSCVLKAICDQIFPGDNNFWKADLKRVIDENEAETVFLLDGLDEIPFNVLNSPTKEDGSEYVLEKILGNKVLKKSCVIVTTRPHMIGYVLTKYSHSSRVQTHGFSLETINKYIADYFAEDESLGDNLKQNLESNKSLQMLAQIPILVLSMCIIWKNKSKSRERLTTLYTELAESLVSRRCNKGENAQELMKSVLRKLGRTALDGLLHPKGERFTFSSEEFDEEDLEDGCRLGFLQQESIMSGLKKVNVVTFICKSFQVYAAAHYLANFPDELNRINASNIDAMKDLLRFTCGISSESPATGLILKHVQTQNRELEHRDTLHELARMFLFESNSSEWAGELERPIQVVWDQRRSWNIDLKLFYYYLYCVPPPLVQINEFKVVCRSYEDLEIWRDILLLGKITPNISFFTRLMAWLKYDRLMAWLKYDPLPSWSYDYTMTDRGSSAMQILEETLQGVDQRIRDELELHLTIDKSSCFDDECVLGHLPYVSNQVTRVYVHDRSYNDVIRLTSALQECSRLRRVALHNTNLQNKLQCVASLVSPSLLFFELKSCGLNDDDIPGLKNILSKCSSLKELSCVKDNVFSHDGEQHLKAHFGSQIIS